MTLNHFLASLENKYLYQSVKVKVWWEV